MQLKKIFLTGVISGSIICGTPVFADSQNVGANSSAGVRIITYSKSGVLYRSEMYVGQDNTPSLVTNYTNAHLPKSGVKKQEFYSLDEFNKARASLDSNYKALIAAKTQSSGNMKVANAADDISIGYIPTSGAIYYGSSDCYKSNPSVTSVTGVQSSMVNVTDISKGGILLNQKFNFGTIMEEGLLDSSFTFDAQYDGKVATGKYYYAAALSALIDSGIGSSDNLTANGEKLLSSNPSAFMRNCGVAGLKNFYGGILTTASIRIVSKSHKLDAELKHDIMADLLLVNLSNSLKAKGNYSKDFEKISVTFNTLGNAPFKTPVNNAADYAEYMANALVQNAALKNQCQTGDQAKNETKPDLNACALYISNMQNAVTQGLIYAQSGITNPPAGMSKAQLAKMLSGQIFPHGIKIKTENTLTPKISGTVNNPYLSYLEARDKNGNGISDPFSENVSGILKNAVRVSNQLNTLAARARLLSSIPGLTTAAERQQLNNIASYYEKDSQSIIAATKVCYDDTMKYYSKFPPQTCTDRRGGKDEQGRDVIDDNGNPIPDENRPIKDKNGNPVLDTSGNPTYYPREGKPINFRLANDEIGYLMTTIPNNVFNLYAKDGIVLPGTVAELLFQNARALQYEATYTEKASGLGIDSNSCPRDGKKKECTVYRAGNEIEFGLVFYNEKNYTPEFFGGNANVPSERSGYFLPTVSEPALGIKSDNQYLNPEFNHVKPGARWWQNYSSKDPIRNVQYYSSNPLYFVINHHNLLPYSISDETAQKVNQATAGTKVLFNKVIGADILTGDSSAKHKDNNENAKSAFTLLGAYVAPSLKELAQDKPLPDAEYALSGYATNNNEKGNKVVDCFAGVYLPKLNFSGKNAYPDLKSNSTYGSADPTQYLCNAGTYTISNSNGNLEADYKVATFKLGAEQEKDHLKLQALDQTVKLQLNPISNNFFGVIDTDSKN